MIPFLKRDKTTWRRPGQALGWTDKIKASVRSAQEQMLVLFSAILLAALVIIPAGLFIWFVFGTDSFSIQAVTVVDAREHTEAAAKKIINEELDKASLNKNIFFVQTEIIDEKILAALPQVRTTHTTRQLPGTIKTVIQEKTSAFLLLSGGKYYFLDSDGIPYEEARLDTLPGMPLLTVKNNDPDAKVVLGVSAVSKPFVDFVQYTAKTLPEEIEAQTAAIKMPSLAAKEVYFILDNNWQIKFDVTRDAAEQIAVLKRIINELVTPEEKPLLEYIDLRIPDRVYYKTKQ
ncbi:MAG: cell division protein FtsQ/DivIB [Candidatus Binatia bacterium]|nr:cell division protein FtsQ/DivIB [Candidatus Binatia bacterium]